MRNLKNTVQLIGNIGQAPEIKEFGQGKMLMRFSLAPNETYKNADGQFVKETQWHNLVVWNNRAKSLSKTLEKGKEIAVEGKLVTRNYEDKTGQKRYVTEIVVNDILLLGHKPAA